MWFVAPLEERQRVFFAQPSKLSALLLLILVRVIQPYVQDSAFSATDSRPRTTLDTRRAWALGPVPSGTCSERTCHMRNEKCGLTSHHPSAYGTIYCCLPMLMLFSGCGFVLRFYRTAAHGITTWYYHMVSAWLLSFNRTAPHRTAPHVSILKNKAPHRTYDYIKNKIRTEPHRSNFTKAVPKKNARMP